MMTRIYMIAALSAMAFFAYAQHQGMSVFGNRGAQPLSSKAGPGGTSWRSGGLSHK